MKLQIKKVLFILIPSLLLAYLLIITLIPRTRFQKPEAKSEILFEQNQETYVRNIPEDHAFQSLNCKSCHTCEYPTKDDPCLINCPRDSMVSVYHSSKEGPNVVVIDEMSENYEGVVFSHKIHAQMSEISTGCTGCHHYNTSGPVLSCRKCHSINRSRENVSAPDLKAAYHRQCLTCHKQWSHENGCSTQCHKLKQTKGKEYLQDMIKTAGSKSHPEFPEPGKMIFETNSDEGKIVTFYHNEHVKLFQISCNKCHGKDNCTKCHDKSGKNSENTSNSGKSFDEQHKLCNSCHYKNNCRKCHSDKETSPFNHGKSSGWTLKSYHSHLSCSRCHGNSIPFKRLNNNCTSCHKNFVKGSFDHGKTGLVLSEVHRELECRECHINEDFTREPKCSGCHDDISYPSKIPGTKGRR